MLAASAMLFFSLSWRRVEGLDNDVAPLPWVYGRRVLHLFLPAFLSFLRVVACLVPVVVLRCPWQSAWME